MRKMASIQQIIDVIDIPGADKICQYQIQGWRVVDSVGKYQVGDLVVFCEVDSWVPTVLASFLSKGNTPREYNGVPGEKLRTIRFRKALSQGLILPIEVLPGGFETGDIVVGMDVSEVLGIQKWEAPEQTHLGGQTKGSFPSYIPKTDQERVQNLTSEIPVWSQTEDLWEVTEKLEGSSMTVFFMEGEFGVCSRNQELKEDETNSFWCASRLYSLREKLTSLGRNIAIQGELIGPSVQGNIYRLNSVDFYVYDIYDIQTGDYLNSEERLTLVKSLGLKHVPVVGLISIKNMSVQDIINSADGLSFLSDVKREGIVFKRAQGGASFKAISNSYLMHNWRSKLDQRISQGTTRNDRTNHDSNPRS